jgi:two-component system, NarL family, nitrate/nitrite response regulator NarL
MTDTTTTKTVAICDTEPIVIEGVRALLESRPDLMLIGCETSLASGMDMVRNLKPAIVIVDKAFGVHALLDWTLRSAGVSAGTSVVVWGTSIHGAEAVRFMQSGARGVVRKTAELESMLDCMLAVSAGKTWLEQSLLSDSERLPRRGRSNLTPREQEVLDLVEQGMKNKDIAAQLGIRPGTVKIHLKHIFEKTGIHGRYGLALSGLKEKGLLSPQPV